MEEAIEFEDGELFGETIDDEEATDDNFESDDGASTLQEEAAILDEWEVDGDEHLAVTDDDEAFNFLTIRLFTSEEIQKMAVCEIHEVDLSKVFGTVTDSRLGPVDFQTPCSTCLRTFKDCPGHYGYIDLESCPILHPLFLKEFSYIFKSICHSCCTPFLSSAEISYLEKCGNEVSLKSIAGWSEYSRCANDCPPNKIFEVKDGRLYFVSNEGKLYERSLSSAKKILEAVDERYWVDVFRMEYTNPASFIIDKLLVIPSQSRPPILLNGEVTDHDLTKCYSDIVRHKFHQHYDLMTKSIYQLFDGFNGIGRRTLGIKQRIQGKKAVVRKNLMGKRVNYCCRSVAAPDPTLDVDEVRVPKVICSKFLHEAQKITESNFDYWKELFQKGQASGGPLEIGRYARRHLMEGDSVTLNRQPTLYKQGFMVHKVRVGEELVIRMHLSVTPLYNADFDGDEVSVMFSPNKNVQQEMRQKMSVSNYIISDHTGKVSVSLSYDALSGLYKMPKEQRPPPFDSLDKISKSTVKQAIYKYHQENGKDATIRLISDTSRAVLEFLEHNILSASYHNLLELMDSSNKQQILEEMRDNFKKANSLEERIGALSFRFPRIEKQNDFLVMVDSETKGTFFHLSQLSYFLGQQFINGTVFLPDAETNRVTPWDSFEEDLSNPELYGFISHSFLEGLSPREMFFHANGGREGLVDTACRTSEVGNLQRNLCKSIENYFLDEKGLVVNSLGEVLSFSDSTLY
ncbi:DNA-directed RNA polymerase II subunit rpb1 [Galdieria sulphuraria]|nr:DNA-directed RNA polymerase II subunit rpb1 [Galdieria sulphuraria]